MTARFDKQAARRKTAIFLEKARLVKKLLHEDLPRMQPAALKHECLTSVANALNHPVAQETDPKTGLTHMIGWGDFFRRLPLVLILEPPPDLTVRHAFTPDMNNPREARLAKKLQAEENEWAKAHDMPRGRAILAALDKPNARDKVNQEGLPGYVKAKLAADLRAVFTEEEFGALGTQWYHTRLIEPERQVKMVGSIRIEVPKDSRRIPELKQNSGFERKPTQAWLPPNFSRT